MSCEKIFQVNDENRLCALIFYLEHGSTCNSEISDVINHLKDLIEIGVFKAAQKDDILLCLAKLMLFEEARLPIVSLFGNLLPELYFRLFNLLKCSSSNNSFPSTLEHMASLSILLLEKGQILLKLIKSFLNWVLEHFLNSFTDEEGDRGGIFSLLQLCYFFSSYERSWKSSFPLNILLRLCKSKNLQVRWYAFKVLYIELKAPDIESQLKIKFKGNDFNSMVLQEFDIKQQIQNFGNNDVDSYLQKVMSPFSSRLFYEKCDFKGFFSPVFNFLFEHRNDRNKEDAFPTLVLTESTKYTLKSIAIGIMSEYPIMLSGETGCGKSTIIESFAAYLGRKTSPDIIKIQLGELTDSKTLLGTYMCSGDNGEFHWQPGTLTQALQHGSWVLFEDINTAPTDVLSMLVALIKLKKIFIPGHPDGIEAASGFQIFATTRSKYAEQSNSTLHLFTKLCLHIKVKNLSKEDLVLIIKSKYPELSTVAEKMVDIYCMVSVDESLITENDVQFSNLKMKSTTRDILKWCSRVVCSNKTFTHEHMFLSALQCFCSSLTLNFQEPVAFSIGAKLGLCKEKVEYYLQNYKPVLNKSETFLEVGTGLLSRRVNPHFKFNCMQQRFAFTRHSLNLLENILLGVVHNEPLLIVGETGCGKTSTVQYLAEQSGRNVVIVNMSQQSDITDLLGGFKPVDAKHVLKPLKNLFEELFYKTFPQDKNAKFLNHINECFEQKKWSNLLKLMLHCSDKALEKFSKEKSEKDLMKNWELFSKKVCNVQEKTKTHQALVFDFVEGALVECLKSGDWLLLDEINLASAETLEYLSGLLDSKSGSLLITERGDIEEVKRHPDFRFFACMNPATDVGKKSLPYGIQNRFTEIYVDEIKDLSDLMTLVAYYLQNMILLPTLLAGIVKFYQVIRIKAQDLLVDGAGQKPHYSLRTLCRALQFAATQTSLPPIRAVFEGVCLSFLTQLDRASYSVVEQLIKTNIFGGIKNLDSILNLPLPKPPGVETLNVQGYWLRTGKDKKIENSSYVITESVKKNLKDLARVVSGGTLPVLIQGETSVGKTSLITYLAQLTRNHCVRINNHEHADIQEYIGSYGADETGNLVFKEGILVTAMRKGYWIILDELNLAPTDVLEALNRLLDDNRELYIAETQELVKAHPQFMLFATQNPPNNYGGRKILSRAFRNRFIELHFDEIPRKELEEILHIRCHLPVSYCKKFVKVMFDLQLRRTSSGIFAGKHSFMTLRDLFRWAERYRMSNVTQDFYDWEQCICEDGFFLIAGRCRKPQESLLIKEVLEENFKKTLNLEQMFAGKSLSSINVWEQISRHSSPDFQHIVWTDSIKRLAVLAARALQFGETILLVGETGCGKTTICQMLANISDQKLYSVNCHMHSEASDFLGGLRPVRKKEEGDQKLFEWCDGPLINSMEEGAMFLIDEISLADDSVLERLNSVLETDRLLVLAEKGESDIDNQKLYVIKAAEKFRLVATMNPGGDFGKKELSPALRNRFTEIWCPSSDSDKDIIKIIEHNIKMGVILGSNDNTSGFGNAIVNFINWLKNTDFGVKLTVSIRDILSWVQFVNISCKGLYDVEQSSCNVYLSPEEAFIHGACLVFVDSIGACSSVQFMFAREAKKIALSYLYKEVGIHDFQNFKSYVVLQEKYFGIHPFYIEKGNSPSPANDHYSLEAKTTQKNALSLLRAMKLSQPILLEGSPGVGKTSLVMTVARLSCHSITRINLSEETDVADLFGADLPMEGETGMFKWRDGPLLKALKNGEWVIFDELNLASQSVLEGLNACFDHRGEIFVPELNKSFKLQKGKTKIFACQNPYHEGNGRKGLPKSFLNRFTKVYVDMLNKDDLLSILNSLFENIPDDCISKMVHFNQTLHKEIIVECNWAKKGSPWEFNVRDLIRWCELLERNKDSHPGDFISMIYLNRMRTIEDREKMLLLYEMIFEDKDMMQRRKTSQCLFELNQNKFKVGFSELVRSKKAILINESSSLQLLRCSLPYIEAIMKCIEMNWMSILVGYECSGKTSIVHLLSHLTGHPLHILSMNSSMDTMDIIGGFEQVSKYIAIDELLHKCIQEVEQAIAFCINANLNQHIDKLLLERQNLQLVFEKREEKKLQILIDEVYSILMSVVQFTQSFGYNCSNLDLFFKKLTSIKEDDNTKTQCGRFEWVDGVLVNAIKNGHWLLIDNANFCSSAVLDRLNGLLEPGGVLTIDERGVVDGEVTSIKPHPDFRIFMTMNPKFGEISRAMRNRGVEIFILSENEGVVKDEIDTKLLMQSVKCKNDLIPGYLSSIFDSKNVSQASIIKAARIFSTLTRHGFSSKVAIAHSYLESCALFDSNLKNFSDLESCDFNSAKELQFISKVPSMQTILNSTEISLCIRNSLPIWATFKSDFISIKIAFLIFCERVSFEHLDFCLFFYNEKLSDMLPSLLCDIGSTLKYISGGLNRDDEGLGSILHLVNNTPKDDLPLVQRIYFYLVLCFSGFKTVLIKDVNESSIFSYSQSFSAGKAKLGVEHKCIPYLFIAFHKLVIFIENIWIKSILFATWEDFAKVEHSFQWFYRFISFCKSSSYHCNQFLLLHWKWFAEGFLSTPGFTIGLPEDLGLCLQRLNEIFQYKCNQFLLSIQMMVGQPAAFTYLEQEKLLSVIKKVAEKICFLPKSESVTVLSKKALSLFSNLWLIKTYCQEIHCEVENLHSEVVMLQNDSNWSINFYDFSRALLLSSTFKMLKNKLLSTDHLINFAINWNLKCLENEGYCKVKNFEQHLMLDAYKELLKDSCIKGNSLQKTISSCASLILFLNNHVDTSNPVQPLVCVTLREFDGLKKKVSDICSILWVNSSILMKQYDILIDDLVHISINDIFILFKNMKVCLTGKDESSCVPGSINEILNIGCDIRSLIVNHSENFDGLDIILGALQDSLLQISNNKYKQEVVAGILSCYSGLLMFHILRPVNKYDVVEEKKLKLRYLYQELEDVNKELAVRFNAEYIWTGFSSLEFENSDDSKLEYLTSNPERVKCLLALRKLLQIEIENTTCELPIRPNITEYQQIYDEFDHYVTSIGSESNIIQLVQLAQSHLLNKDESNVTFIKQISTILQKLNAWNISSAQFISKMEMLYPFYKDITTIPLIAIQKCQTGFTLLRDALSSIIAKMHYTYPCQCDNSMLVFPWDVFDKICNIWQYSSLEAARYLCSEELHLALNSIEMIPDVNYIKLFTLHTALLNLAEHKLSNKIMDNLTTCMLHNLLEKLFNIWTIKQYQEKQKQNERESLFKYKSQSHCEEKTEEEEDLKLQEKLFPTYESQFLNLKIESNLETKVEKKSFSVDCVANVDQKLVYNAIKSIYLNKKDDQSQKSESKISSSFFYVLSILKMEHVFSNVNFDHCTTSLFVTFSEIMQHMCIDEQAQIDQFNIYIDCNIRESLCCQSILQEFLIYVRKLLMEFIDHPALKQIEKVIDYLLSLSVYSPLMKFVSGFEFLLTQCNSWEDYAGSHVSLKHHLQAVSQKILEWRRIELNEWKKLLDQTEYEAADVSSFWFHFYNICHNLHEKNEEEIKSTLELIVLAVKEFFEGSNVGEFSSRLELVYTLYAYLSSNGAEQGIINAVWNTWMYYGQFQSAVGLYISEAKKPIEQQLKDFVKITKWTDINYYALKETVSKAHKTLRKFVQKYKKILREPVLRFFKDMKALNSSSEKHASEKIFEFALRINKGLFIDSQMADFTITNFLNKVPKLQFKMKKHIKYIAESMGYGSLTQTLDEFTEEIIESALELQKDNISNLPKEKQKGARSLLQQQKRKALSLLFRELRRIGISYRKGILLSSNEEDLSNIPVLDENDFNEFKETKDVIATANLYYFRCVAKNSFFSSALCSPSKEISPAEISRFKGLCGHLHFLVIEQRKQILGLVTGLHHLRSSKKCCEELKSSKSYGILPPQNTTKHWHSEVISQLFNTRDSLTNFKKILSYCPSQYPENESSASFSPSTPSQLSEMSSWCKDSSLLKETMNKIQASLDTLQDACKIATSPCENDLFYWCHWESLSVNLKNLKHIADSIKDVEVLFTSSSNYYSGSFMDNLIKVNNANTSLLEKFSHITFKDHQDDSASEHFLEKLESFVKVMLISVQNLVKNAGEFKQKVKTEKEENNTELITGLFVPLLSNNFITHTTFIQLKSLLDGWSQIFKHLQTVFVDSCNNSKFYSLLFVLLPLIDMFSSLVEFYTFHWVVLHKTSCKLLMVLYNLFTDLLEKGYCIPAEEDNTLETEGATEFEDVQPSGLGEGQGVKDVSNEIESEDQVEDTKHGDQVQDEQPDKDDIKEEKEGIEMTDDFDSHLQDVEDIDESSGEEDENLKEDIEEQVGDVDNAEDTVDKKMWSDDEEEEDMSDSDNDLNGEGADSSNSQLVANEDNSGEQTGDNKKEESKKEFNEEFNEENLDEELKNQNKDDDDDDDEQKSKDQKDRDDQDLSIDMENDMVEDDVNENIDNPDKNEEMMDEGSDENNQEIEKEEPALENEGVDKQIDESNEMTPDQEELNQTEDHALQPKDSSENAEQAPDNMFSHSKSQIQQDQDEEKHKNESDGNADSTGLKGNLGSDDCLSKQRSAQTKGQKRKGMQRSNENRTEDITESVEVKKRKAFDAEKDDSSADEGGKENDSESYQHIKNDNSSYDQLIVDSATQSQIKDKLQKITIEDSSSVAEEEENFAINESSKKKDAEDLDLKLKQVDYMEDNQMEQKDLEDTADLEVEELAIYKDYKTGFFTGEDSSFSIDLEKKEKTLELLRRELEKGLFSLSLQRSQVKDPKQALDMWMKYDRLTSSLAQQLCEQLRLVLEPTLASKMKGDYRTGKRINMRKVIPYIASQFRKDKIWLRRTKKNKRKYQIVLAVDDSSSMADNHSKQLAFESIAVISNALKLLEAGELALCSFGEDARLVHPFEETFSELSGASVLQEFSFEQKKTNVSQLLNMCSVLLNTFSRDNVDISISKLLLIVSDGRGIFLEGKEVVRRAVCQARDAGVFVVFIILDNPNNKDSILDIKIPIFPQGGGLPQIKAYMEEFPFPFYVVLREINSLPSVLGDALRQWFELVSQDA